MKTITRIALSLMLLAILLIAGFLIIISHTDINRYRVSINAELSELVGHKTTIEGSLKWTWWPFFGFEANDIVVTDEKSANKKELLTIKKLHAHVNYGPLFEGAITIKKLDLENAVFSLPWPANRTYNKTKPISLATAKQDTQNLKRLINIEALNFSNIIFKLKNYTIRLAKIQAINLHTGKPFPFFIEMHVSNPQRNNQHFNTPFRVYDGRMKGIISHPYTLAANEHPMARLHVDAELRAQEVRLMDSFLHNLTAKIVLDNGVIHGTNIQAEAGQGHVSGNIMINLLKEVFSIDLVGEDIETKKVQKLTETAFTGKLNLKLKISSILRQKEEVIKNASGELSFKIKEGSIKQVSINKIIHATDELMNGLDSLTPDAKKAHIDSMKVKSLTDKRHNFTFNHYSSTFSFNNGDYALKQNTVYAPPYTIIIEGNINGEDDEYKLHATLLIDKTKLETLSENIKKIDGKIPLVVRGVRGAPIIYLDVDSLLTQIQK